MNNGTASLFRIVGVCAVIGAVIFGAVKIANKPDNCTSYKGKTVIATTIVPLTSVVKTMVDDSFIVETVLPSGADPHEVTLSPREIHTLACAQVVVSLGLGLDTWVDKGIHAAGNDAVRHIRAETYAALPGEQLSNPHVWLSPRRMLRMYNGIAGALATFIPTRSTLIEARAATFRPQLEALDADYGALGKLSQRDIITLHDAFTYMAGDYGLTIAGVIEEVPEDTPTPQQVAHIISILSTHPRVALFGETDVSAAIITVIAQDTGRTLHTLNSLEVGAADTDIYVRTMRSNLTELLQTLGGAQGALPNSN